MTKEYNSKRKFLEKITLASIVLAIGGLTKSTVEGQSNKLSEIGESEDGLVSIQLSPSEDLRDKDLIHRSISVPESWPKQNVDDRIGFNFRLKQTPSQIKLRGENAYEGEIFTRDVVVEIFSPENQNALYAEALDMKAWTQSSDSSQRRTSVNKIANLDLETLPAIIRVDIQHNGKEISQVIEFKPEQ